MAGLAFARLVFASLALVNLPGAIMPSLAGAPIFVIDPDPSSPSLGDLVDRERARLPLAAPGPPVRRVRQPVIPQDAVTVIAPGVRMRHRAGAAAR